MTAPGSIQAVYAKNDEQVTNNEHKAQEVRQAAPKQLNVLELMNFAAPYPGNFFRSLSALEKEISARGGSVVFVMPERAAGLDWVVVEVRSGKNILFLPAERLKAAKMLGNIMKNHSVNIVHSHFIDAGMYVPLWLARLRYRAAAHIFHAHSMPRFHIGGAADVLRKHLVGAQQYLCVSEAVAEAYTKAHRKCITVVNAIDFSRLVKVPEYEKETADGTEGKKSLLVFGYNFSIKGIDTVLNTLETYDKRHDYTVMICSARGVEDAAEQVRQTLGKIPDWVQLLPPRDDIATHYKKADAFLSASRHEGFGYAVVEAAAMNLPLILSSIPAHRELAFPHAEYFETDNKHALYEAILAAFSKSVEEKIKETSENASYARNQFSIDRWAADTADILENINEIMEMKQ